MKNLIKILLGTLLLSIICSSCEKACICRNIDNGASEELYGLYSKKECEAYTDYYQTLYDVDNVDCSYEWR
ncbi:MAG: hypothetical protein E7066_03110 [Lentimicrobiaceae bacterium]|nr:hypothetical protein [Lentimicrobiaceae bacterium]